MSNAQNNEAPITRQEFVDLRHMCSSSFYNSGHVMIAVRETKACIAEIKESTTDISKLVKVFLDTIRATQARAPSERQRSPEQLRQADGDKEEEPEDLGLGPYPPVPSVDAPPVPQPEVLEGRKREQKQKRKSKRLEAREPALAAREPAAMPDPQTDERQLTEAEQEYVNDFKTL